MRNETRQYWFKRRRFGWGWTPVTWQGWVVVAAFIVALIAAASQLPTQPQEPTREDWLKFLIIVIPAVAGLLAISYAKGPSPRWRWGKQAEDDPDQDF